MEFKRLTLVLYPLYPLFCVNYDKIAKLIDSFNWANSKNRHVSNRIRRVRRSALTRTNRWITGTRSDSGKLTAPNNSEFIAEMLSDWDTRPGIIDLYIYTRDLASCASCASLRIDYIFASDVTARIKIKEIGLLDFAKIFSSPLLRNSPFHYLRSEIFTILRASDYIETRSLRIVQSKNYLLCLQVLGGLGRRMSSGDKASPGLTIDRAAFLLLRVKKAFKKKKQQRKEKRWVVGPLI